MKNYYRGHAEKMRQSHDKWRNKINWNELCAKQRKKNPEMIKRINRKYRQNHPEIMLKGLMRHFKKYGKIFDLSDKEYQYALFQWSRIVKKILGYSCVICGIKPAQSHHIFHRSKYPKLSLNINNGVPLCKIHHNEVHGWRSPD